MNKKVFSKSFQKLIIALFIGLSIQTTKISAQDGGVGISYTINKADTNAPSARTSVIEFPEQVLLSLPGRTVRDNDVKSLINQKEFYWDVTKDTIPYQKDTIKHYFIQKTYFNYKEGFEMIMDADTLKWIVLYNNYEEKPSKIWKRYKGKLPYKLDFDLRRVFVERLLGKPDFVGSKGLTVGYLDRHLIITYNDADPESGIIDSITIEKK
jgi:hypothetical protein